MENEDRESEKGPQKNKIEKAQQKTLSNTYPQNYKKYPKYLKQKLNHNSLHSSDQRIKSKLEL